MQLNFQILANSFVLVFFFIVFRAAGKFLGTKVGARISGAPAMVNRYAAGGLIPQGGIVIGLALIIKQNPSFASISDIILSLIIGTTVIHELIGPFLAKVVLEKSGEIKRLS